MKSELNADLDISKASQSEKSSGRNIVVNSIWNLAAYVFAIVVGILAVPIYIHMLGLGHYGIVVILNSMLAPIGLLNLSFGEATIKYVAESLGRGDTKTAGAYVRTTLLFNLVGGLIGMVLIAVLAKWLATMVFNIDPADQQVAQAAFYWVALGWFVSEIAGTYVAIPTALQRYRIVAIGNSLSNSIATIVGLVAVVLGGDVLTLVQTRVIWGILVLIGWAIAARRLLPGVPLLPGWDRVAFRRSARYGFWQTVAGIGGVFANQTDKFILGVYLTTASVGMYNIAQTIQTTVYSAIYKLSEVLFPAISNLQGRGEDRRAVDLMLRSGWLLSLLTVAAMGTTVVFAYDLLRLYVGVEIANSVGWLLQVIGLASILSSGSVSVAQYLMGVGKTAWMAATALATGLIVLGVGLLLVPHYGLIGAGWAQILAILLSRPVIHFLLWRSSLRETIPGRIYFSYLYGPAVIGIACTTILAAARARLAWTPGVFGLATAGLMSAGALFGVVIVTDRLLPGSAQRRADLMSLAALALARSRRVLYWSSTAIEHRTHRSFVAVKDHGAAVTEVNEEVVL
jgi:O-antigen/teichoic acid export membrane protein